MRRSKRPIQQKFPQKNPKVTVRIDGESHTSKNVFTQVYTTRSLANSTSCNVKNPIKHIRMPIMKTYPAQKTEYVKYTYHNKYFKLMTLFSLKSFDASKVSGNSMSDIHHVDHNTYFKLKTLFSLKSLIPAMFHQTAFGCFILYDFIKSNLRQMCV